MAKPSDSISIEKTQINSSENDNATNAIFSTFPSSSTSVSLPTSTSTSTLLAGNAIISNSSSSISQLTSNVINYSDNHSFNLLSPNNNNNNDNNNKINSINLSIINNNVDNVTGMDSTYTPTGNQSTSVTPVDTIGTYVMLSFCVVFLSTFFSVTKI